MDCVRSFNLQRSYLQQLVRNALKEDIGKRDITTELTIPANKTVKAVLLVKEDAVICGLDVARFAFKAKDSKIRFKSVVKDGQYVKRGKILAYIQGKARSILTAERVALNFLCLLSGIATKTKEFADAVKPYKVKIMDTRKTLPGLRQLQKYAVRIGGGYNHRMSLEEMVLVKDNHLAALCVERPRRDVKMIINTISSKKPEDKKLEIEVNNLREFREILRLNPDMIMLDNMSIRDMGRAVEIRNSLSANTCNLKPKLEASGGIDLENVKRVAATGVDMVSVGTLTDSLKSVDISLEVI